MTLFAPDLYRNVAIGFAIGTALLGVARFEEWSDEIAPPAQAAEQLAAPAPSPDFWTLDQ